MTMQKRHMTFFDESRIIFLVVSESQTDWKKNIYLNNPWNYVVMKALTSSTKEGCVFPIVVVSSLPQAQLRQYDHQKHAPHFIKKLKKRSLKKLIYFSMKVQMVNQWRNLMY